MTLNFYLAELLLQLYKAMGDNWRALAKDIAENDEDGQKMDRRKLARLAESNDTVRLTIPEMRCLQKYVVGAGLARLQENVFFRPPASSLLDGLQDEKKLTILYPSRYLRDFNTEGVSRWDIQAIEVLNGAPEISALNVTRQDVFHMGTTGADAETLRQSQDTASWHGLLDSGTALICIGAPFACYASEEVLARMFGIEPYQPYGLDVKHRLPFYLYWPEHEQWSDSAFSVDGAELERLYPEQFERMGAKTRGILLGDNLYPAPKFGESLNLVIAQYWGGHLVMVLLGVYAPATLSIAELVADRRLHKSLGRYQFMPEKPGAKTESQPILINTIRATITRTGEDGRPADDGSDRVAAAAARPRKESDQARPAGRDVRRQAGAEPVGWERWQRRGKAHTKIECGSYSSAPSQG